MGNNEGTTGSKTQRHSDVVKARFGKTVNLGNYESARFELEIELPAAEYPEWAAGAYCQGLVEGWEAAYRKSRSAVDEALADMKAKVSRSTPAPRTRARAKWVPSAPDKSDKASNGPQTGSTATAATVSATPPSVSP